MRSKTILIAYQDHLWAKSLSIFFHGMGYRVEATLGIGEMIRRIRKGNVHIMLIDDEIEGVGACEVIPLLKHINPKIQIIVISSEVSIGFVKRLRGAGIFYQAMKPIDLVEIRSAVECAVGKIERENPREGFFFFPMAEMLPA